MSFVEIVDVGASVANILLVLGLVFAYRQIKIASKDIQTRSKREAGELAARQALVFSEQIIPIYSSIQDRLRGVVSI